MQFTNEDFLSALREAQDSAKARGPSFGEYRQDVTKAGKPVPSTMGAYSPGFGLMGHLNTSSRAPYGPPDRPSGNRAVGLKQFPEQFGVPSGIDGGRPSKYDTARPEQPPPWIDDVNMSSIWYSPMEPVWPFGPPYYTVPREWNFPVGYNLNYVPERLNLVGMLRGMRQSWGILATVIQTRKDQLLRLPWTIQVRNKPRATSRAVDEMRSFFRRPDGKLSYSQWTRKLLDDLFVVDAPTLYVDRDLGGRVKNMQVLDGGTIFPLIDDAGRRPDTRAMVDDNGVIYEERQPAFQQIIYGFPMINLSEDELIYAMMNPLPDLPVFGFSPVQQILTEATEAIRKTFYQLEFWRAGSMPEMIVTVPDTWTPRQIATFQAHFDALLSGQLTLKSKVRFVPGGMKPFDIKNASGQSLWSERDELLVRLCCYSFSVSPTPFVKQTNRATANQAAETAQEEGLYPLMSYWKDDIMDTIIQEKFGYHDVEFVFLPRPTPDQLKQSQIYDMSVKEGWRSRNEVRAELGLEPIPDGDFLTVTTGASVLRLDQVISGEAMMPGQPKPPEGSPPKPPTQSSAPRVPIRGGGRPREASPQPSAPPSKESPIHKVIDAKELAHAADAADTNPSRNRKKNGNYKKGHIRLHGLGISIENAKGSKRGEKDRFGQNRNVKMPAAYGYIKGTIGADDMQMDCYVGKHPESKTIWIIDQDRFDPDGGDKGFDEHKVMLGYNKPEKALKDYLKSHYDGLGHERMSAMTEVSYDELKDWLKDGDMRKPISEQGIGHVVARRGVGNGVTKADTIGQATGLVWYDQTTPTKRRRRRKKDKRLRSGPRWLTLKGE
jgi:hypothetical protein